MTSQLLHSDHCSTNDAIRPGLPALVPPPQMFTLLHQGEGPGTL